MKALRPVVLVLAVLICVNVALSQTVSFAGKVRSDIPPFRIEYSGTTHEPSGFIAIQSIAIRQRDTTVQTIHFSGDNVPHVRDLRAAVQLRDINCDGYKDLLIEFSSGVHGDSWYHLYLFDPKMGTFVAYQRFSELPFKQVSCRTKEVSTYVNSGQSGCAYESGLYRWVHDELEPVRIESQQASDEQWTNFTRTIRTWNAGEESQRTLRVPGGDCHR